MEALTNPPPLARWTGEAGDVAGARDLFAELLPVRERLPGTEHPRHPHLFRRAANSNEANFAGFGGSGFNNLRFRVCNWNTNTGTVGTCGSS